jgi:hypothetical protein
MFHQRSDHRRLVPTTRRSSCSAPAAAAAERAQCLHHQQGLEMSAHLPVVFPWCSRQAKSCCQFRHFACASVFVGVMLTFVSMSCVGIYFFGSRFLVRMSLELLLSCQGIEVSWDEPRHVLTESVIVLHDKFKCLLDRCR